MTDEQATMASAPTPDRVFTPRAPVDDQMFVNRVGGQIGYKLTAGMSELGSQVIVYGDTGVGKTSLVLRVGGEAVARFECHAAKSFADLINDAFGALGVEQELRVVQENTVETGGGIGLGRVASLRRTNVETDKVEVAVASEPLIEALLGGLQRKGKRILFLDNFENVDSEEVHKGVADLLVAFSDRARDTGNTKVVIGGISESGAALLRLSDAASRRTVALEVTTMTDNEISQIVERGFGLLGLTIGDGQRAQIVKLSSGFPYVAHLICLHAANLIRGGNRGEDTAVTAEHVQLAVRTAIEEFQLDLRPKYEVAVEQTGPVRPRQRILHAMAEEDSREFRFRDILDSVNKKFGGRTDYTYFNAAIGLLCQEKYGGLLRKRRQHGRGIYSFVNPLARPFIRMMDEQGIDFDEA